MKAVLCCHADLSPHDHQRVEGRAEACSTGKVEQPLLSEIRHLGGEERMRGAEGALDAFQSALAELVRENPKRYGADHDAASQARVVSQLADSVSRPFLLRTIENLRLQAGYVKLCGHWVHRAVFTFIGFGFLAAAVLPFCAVSLLSTTAWGWLPGTLGIGGALLLGAWILHRVRSN